MKKLLSLTCDAESQSRMVHFNEVTRKKPTPRAACKWSFLNNLACKLAWRLIAELEKSVFHSRTPSCLLKFVCTAVVSTNQSASRSTGGNSWPVFASKRNHPACLQPSPENLIGPLKKMNKQNQNLAIKADAKLKFFCLDLLVRENRQSLRSIIAARLLPCGLCCVAPTSRIRLCRVTDVEAFGNIKAPPPPCLSKAGLTADKLQEGSRQCEK